jgi:hypothetical protein
VRPRELPYLRVLGQMTFWQRRHGSLKRRAKIKRLGVPSFNYVAKSRDPNDYHSGDAKDDAGTSFRELRF